MIVELGVPSATLDSLLQEPKAISLRQYLREIHRHGSYAGHFKYCFNLLCTLKP